MIPLSGPLAPRNQRLGLINGRLPFAGGHRRRPPPIPMATQARGYALAAIVALATLLAPAPPLAAEFEGRETGRASSPPTLLRVGPTRQLTRPLKVTTSRSSKGAVESARIIQALQTEASIRPIYQGMPSLAESIAMIQRMGFEVSGLFPVNHETFPMLLEVDCHMVACDRCRRGDGLHKKEPQVA